MTSRATARSTVAHRLAGAGYWVVGGAYFTFWLALVSALTPLRSSLAFMRAPLVVLTVVVGLVGIAMSVTAMLLW